jgi:hypothetical protein
MNPSVLPRLAAAAILAAATASCTGSNMPRTDAAPESAVTDTPRIDSADDTAATTCTEGDTRPCYSGPAGTEGVGICAGGTETCGTNGEWSGACDGEVLPATGEQCTNTLDDDCDGVVNQSCCPGQDLASRTGTPVVTGMSSTAGSAISGSCGGRGGEVTFRWQAPSAGRYEFATAGSSYDTVLYVRTGSCTGSEIGCNDDAASGQTSSAVTIDLTAGQTVIVVVDSYSAMTTSGTFALGIRDVPVGECMPGTSRACYSGATGTRDVGTCHGGTQTCDASGSWPSACAGESLPAASETCGNSVDDNCNGTVDEACPVCVSGQTMNTLFPR